MSSAFKKIMKYSLIFFAIISIFMIFATIESYTYLLGWIAGSLASTLGFCLSFFVIWVFTKSAKTKAYGFIAGFVKIWAVLTFHALYLLTLITINSYFSNGKIWELSISSIVNPINFFTYLFGISLIPIGSFIWAISTRKEGDNAKVCHRI